MAAQETRREVLYIIIIISRNLMELSCDLMSTAADHTGCSNEKEKKCNNKVLGDEIIITCSTPKGKRYRIPKPQYSCPPPAPMKKKKKKKRRLAEDYCSSWEGSSVRPLFFTSPDIEKFFSTAFQKISSPTDLLFATNHHLHTNQ